VLLNSFVTLEKDDIFLPNGNKSIYGRVHSKNLSAGNSPLDNKDNTRLARQYRYPIKSFSWEILISGGLLMINWLEIAKWELKEETRLIANRWDKLPIVHTSNSVTDETAVIFLSTELDQEQPSPENSEVLSIYKVCLAEALEMVMENRVSEPISVSAFLFLAPKTRNY